MSCVSRRRRQRSPRNAGAKRLLCVACKNLRAVRVEVNLDGNWPALRHGECMDRSVMTRVSRVLAVLAIAALAASPVFADGKKGKPAFKAPPVPVLTVP